MTQLSDHVPGAPVKSFFVHMLTRDITLQDAILDLVDNSVDGIQRSATKSKQRRAKPYSGYWAKLKLDENGFSIEDNCGGIPWKNHEYAFRLGRIKQDIDTGKKTVGTYGIGMKRAIFKIGRECEILSHAKDRTYSVSFSKNWMSDESTWDLPVRDVKRASKNDFGTKVSINTLNDSVKKQFSDKDFTNALIESIETHYAFIIEKGFKVFVNGREVKPKTIKLAFQMPGKAKKDHSIAPYMYKMSKGGVDVFLTVGFTAPIPSKTEADEAHENHRDTYSSAHAGWTIVCNDRTVVYCDKTALTGWGVSGVPQYHTQFVAISGIVTFESTDASKLPTTTTKRGIDANNELYLIVRDKMIEGIKLFTQYTNVWKSPDRVSISKQKIKSSQLLEAQQLRTKFDSMTTTASRGGRQYKPSLPKPKQGQSNKRIAFTRSIEDIDDVSEYLFGNTTTEAGVVGEACFNEVLGEARS